VRNRLGVGNRPDRIPLSHPQRRIWVIDRFRGQTAAFTIPLAWRLFGHLDTGALHLAIHDLLERHESLRTVFDEVDGEPVQRVLDVEEVCCPFSVTVADAMNTDLAVTNAVNYRFDLYTEVPIRVTAVDVRTMGAHRRPTDVWILVIVVHHVAGDGASIAPLMGDIATAYSARMRGGAPSWAPLPAQYADFALWQRETLDALTDPASTASSQLNYWRRELEGVRDVSSLPTDRPRPAVASHRGDTVEFRIDHTLRGAIEECARDRGATVSMVLQAALAVLVSMTGGGEDVIIGGPIAGRTDEALTDLVGFFANMWVLRVDMAGNPAFGEVIERVRSKALGAYENQGIPFDRMVDLLDISRSPSYHPVFQIRFAWNEDTEVPPSFPGLDAEGEPIPASDRIGWYDCFFNMTTFLSGSGGKRSILGIVHYATALFDRHTIEDLASEFVRILQRGVNHPDQVVKIRGQTKLAQNRLTQ
jgi:Condensation domain